MAKKIFRSKVDGWIRLCLVGTVIAELLVMFAIAPGLGDPLATTLTILACLAAAMFVVSILVNTAYTVGDGQLIVRSGPIRWTISLDSIKSVEATRNPLSSPALSLDRLKISYGSNRRIMVSPADRDGFLKAIGVHSGGRPGMEE